MDQVIQHFSHGHPLRLIGDPNKVPYSDPWEYLPHFIDYCRICGFGVTAPLFYTCESCKYYYVHKSCAELPRQITHPFHPSHPLTLECNRLFQCSSCRRSLRYDAATFRCEQCDFNMDIKCAMMPTVATTHEKSYQHFTHPHPLLPSTHPTECVACGSKCSSGEAYGCKECDFFLDKSCLELPKQITLPSHHAFLSLRIINGGFSCRVCENYFWSKRYGFTFQCAQFEFQMCVKCSKIPMILQCFKYQDHEHLLCFFENLCSKIEQCDGYDGYCTQPVVSRSNEFGPTQFYTWQCLDCDFVLHLLCGPLPSMIKHKWHVDPLTLVDSPLEDEYDQYYCDVCETTRDPRIRFYSCVDCKYFAHVHCVIPEIVKVVTEKLEPHVELKTIAGDIGKALADDDPFLEHGTSTTSSLTLKDLLNGLPNDEKEAVRKFFRWDDNKDRHERKKGKKGELASTSSQDDYYHLLKDEEINDILLLSSFTEDTVKKFFDELQDDDAIKPVELKSTDLSLTIVKVKGGYMIPRQLSGVLKALFNQYGDKMSIRSSETSLEMKSFVYFVLCKLVRRMRTTLVEDITKNLFVEWVTHMKFVSDNDLEFDSLFPELDEDIATAFLGFQAKRLEQEIPKMLEKKIAFLQEGLKKCEEYRVTSDKSKVLTDCLNRASQLKWKHVLEDLPPIIDSDED